MFMINPSRMRAMVGAAAGAAVRDPAVNAGPARIDPAKVPNLSAAIGAANAGRHRCRDDAGMMPG
jgi:hypothetical protein